MGLLSVNIFLYIHNFKQKSLDQSVNLSYIKDDMRITIYKYDNLIEVHNKDSLVKSVFYNEPEYAIRRIHDLWRI